MRASFKLPHAALLICTALAPLALHATENGLLTYPVGVSTVLNGVVPPPGQTQFYSYTLHYSASKFAGPDGNSAVPNFRTSVTVEAPRFLHTWQPTFGPFTLTTGAVLPLVHVKLDVPGASDSRSGLGDAIVHALLFGYSNPEHTFFGSFSPLDIGLPTGAYSVGRLANTGLNSYAYLSNLNLTWFPTRQWELSSSAQLEVNAPNKDTKYHSGSVATLDFLAAYSVTDKLQLGLQGYALKQLRDDTQNGVRVGPDGFRGRAFALGPQIRYDFAPASGIVLKYQHEMGVRNRAQGNKLWFQVSLPLP